MKKETLVAVFLGIAAGVAVAFFMLNKAHQNQMMSTKSLTTSLHVTPTIAQQKNEVGVLEVSSPTDGSITSDTSVSIKGKASKDALIVVQSPMKNVVQKATGDSFSIDDFPLAMGENVIRVSVYPADTTLPVQEKELKVYYLDEQ